MNLPFCHFAWGLYCEEVYTGKQVMPGANKYDSKYNIVKKLGGKIAKPEKTNIEFVSLETKEYLLLYIYIRSTIFPKMWL